MPNVTPNVMPMRKGPEKDGIAYKYETELTHKRHPLILVYIPEEEKRQKKENLMHKAPINIHG